MSYGYPSGCTQTDHDRAFNELGPSPAELAAEADAQNDQAWQDELDDAPLPDPDRNDVDNYYPPEEMMSKRDAATITRIFVRIQEQIEYAARSTEPGSYKNTLSLCRIMGKLQFLVFGGAWHTGRW